MIELCH